MKFQVVELAAIN